MGRYDDLLKELGIDYFDYDCYYESGCNIHCDAWDKYEKGEITRDYLDKVEELYDRIVSDKCDDIFYKGEYNSYGECIDDEEYEDWEGSEELEYWEE